MVKLHGRFGKSSTKQPVFEKAQRLSLSVRRGGTGTIALKKKPSIRERNKTRRYHMLSS